MIDHDVASQYGPLRKATGATRDRFTDPTQLREHTWTRRWYEGWMRARMLGRLPSLVCLGVGSLALVACRAPPRPAQVIERKWAVAPEPKKGPPFDPRAARGALWNVNVSHCKAQGVPQGRGHAYVTFAPEGGVTKVTIDQPYDLPGPASKCVADALSKVTVTEFGGTPATIGASWVVP